MNAAPQFLRQDRYHEQSDCGTYRVSACSVTGVWYFAAYRLDGKRWVELGVFSSSDAARANCLQFAQGTAR